MLCCFLYNGPIMKPIKYNNETFDEWIEIVIHFEKWYAGQQLAAGNAVDAVLTSMSKRIIQKLSVPCYSQMKIALAKPYDSDKSQLAYQTAYIDLMKLSAEH